MSMLGQAGREGWDTNQETADLRAEFAQFRLDMRRAIRRQTLKLAVLTMVFNGGTFAALKLT